ncbi:nuclease-related domain-containing protein [Ornithinibacillus contaminans]|uniref:nuclease-related domain-containing protein n=1 Tax=Ornithinibacillus contaminans TaxID=694055 RepID=UPI00069FCB64|nr:nuclease-related domain-containing protein [Ornithinibacillus contaminans]
MEKAVVPMEQGNATDGSKQKNQEHVAKRKGEIGEYKINIQLDQLPKEYRHLVDIMVENPKSTSGYSQIDHVLLTPYGIFVIETKNYQGTIYGGKNRKQWSVNGKFKMMNPFKKSHRGISSEKCVVCHKQVTDKVADFCKNNKRFAGKIYCYDHQKNIGK